MLCNKLIVVTLICVFAAGYARAQSNIVPERRKAQFESETGYAAFPFPYSLPGIGSGVSFVGAASNIFDSYTDVYGIALAGDITGIGLGLTEIHLLPEHLFLDIGSSNISRATIQSYNGRGMNTDADDYNLIEVGDVAAKGGQLTASIFQRRLEFYAARYLFAAHLESIRDKDGAVIVEAQNGGEIRGGQNVFGALVDLTDDHSDPRVGARLDISGWQTPKHRDGPEYVLLDINTSVYFPMGKHSTWVVNYLHSDAHVSKKGETDRAVLETETGLYCSMLSDAADRAECDKYIDNAIAQNRYGAASSLGGETRLRAYPQGRYNGAHTRFLGTEFRWNLTDEHTPFNWYVIRDVRTTIQLAFFLEAGTTADEHRDLGQKTRYAYGVGARLVTASGAVLRGELAAGSEGLVPVITFGYPWGAY